MFSCPLTNVWMEKPSVKVWNTRNSLSFRTGIVPDAETAPRRSGQSARSSLKLPRPSGWGFFQWAVGLGLIAATAWYAGPVAAQEYPAIPAPLWETFSRGEDYILLSGTRISIGPPTVDGAVATITIDNVPMNGTVDNRTETITWNSIAAEITFRWNEYGSEDTVYVSAPGYVAVPPTIDVPEGRIGEVHLYARGVGS